MASSNKTPEFFYGWDLLHQTIKGDVVKKPDLLIALAHFLLTKHYSFRCVGIGDDKTFPEDDPGSELLPENWNGDETKYSLRYVHDKVLYLLLGHITEDALLINLLDTNTKKVSNICIEPDTLVATMQGSFNNILPTASQIVDRYRKELLDPVFTGNSREVTTQTTTTTHTPTSSVDPLRIGEPRRPGLFMPYNTEPRSFGIPGVGSGDLDPLGRAGPGNLFPIDGHRNLFAQPRFDPFGALDPNIPGNPDRVGPNPDHIRPPNWGPGGPDYYM